jgi:hypothetical protein
MAASDRFPAVFAQLKGILQPFAEHLRVQADTPDNYSLDIPYVQEFKKELFFGAVQIKKNYVSYHLMPVYVVPALLDGISAKLKKRMQGKSCFNFTNVDQDTLDELAELTARGFEQFKRAYQL